LTPVASRSATSVRPALLCWALAGSTATNVGAEPILAYSAAASTFAEGST
jgi:hypothetical protein